MTAGEQLIEQGRMQGRQEGRQDAERSVLLRLLRQRFGAQVDVEMEQRLTNASREQIELWTDRVLSAATLRDVLAD